MFSKTLFTVAVLFLALLSTPILAESQGVGAVLKEDCDSFTNSKADKVECHLRAGTFFGFYKGMTWGDYKSDNGYIRVAFFADNDSGSEKFTWVAEDKLEFFFFPCAEGASGFSTRGKSCVPIQVKGFHHQWNLEFKVSARSKCKELKIEPAKEPLITLQPVKKEEKQEPIAEVK